MNDELTREDIRKMKEELDYRRLELMPGLIEEVKRTRAFGDLSENFEYKAAKQAQNKNRSRIRYLEGMIKSAKVIDDRSASDEVGLFDKVEIYIPEDDDDARLSKSSRPYAATRCTGLSARNPRSAKRCWGRRSAINSPSTSATPTATRRRYAGSPKARTTARPR